MRSSSTQSNDKPADIGEPGAPVPSLTPALQKTFAALLERMQQKGDFPALSSTIGRIQGISSSDSESLATLTNEILKDVALTNKLLRLVNTVHYARGSSVNTVSRAVSLVGFNGIRNLTLSLVLLEHMKDKAHADLIKQEFLRSLVAASIAREISTQRGEGEEAFIGAMFQNLGRLVTEYYFPQEAQGVRDLMRGDDPIDETSASIQVLGLSFEQIGLGTAKAWHLPEVILRCIRKPVGKPPVVTPASPEERLRWVALAANDVADQLLLGEPREMSARLGQISTLYARSIGLNSRETDRAIHRARERANELSRVMGIRIIPGSLAAKLLQPSYLRKEDGEAGEGGMPDDTLLTAVPDDGDMQVPAAMRSVNMLLAGVHDVTNAMLEEFKLSDILRTILEAMFRAMHFDRVVFCMRDAKGDALSGRFGLGQGVEAIVHAFHIPLVETPTNMFSTICMRGADTLIGNAKDVRFADRLPEWYRHSVDGATFLLLPLLLKGKPFGLIYADKRTGDKLKVSERELALLRTLRSQAVMAFKQSS